MNNQELEKENIEKQEKTKRKKFKKILLLFLFLFFLFYFYIRFIEPNTIIVHEYPIVDNQLPASFDGTKIVHFSDILFGTTIQEKNLQKLVTKINTQKADIVVFTGDLFNNMVHLEEKNYTLIKEQLKHINATYRKYAVIGNCDLENLSIYKDIMEGAGFIVLENKNELLYFGGNDPLLFIGTSSIKDENLNLTTATKVEDENANYYKIWLSHEPQLIDTLYQKNLLPNLMLSGHTLHGLVSLPFQNYLLNQEGIKEYPKGYYEIEETKMFISSGIGTYKYNVRFLNYPSITLYRLYSHL